MTLREEKKDVGEKSLLKLINSVFPSIFKFP